MQQINDFLLHWIATPFKNKLHALVFIWASIPIYALFIPVEIIISNWTHRHFYSLKETITNVYLNLLNSGIDALLRVVALFVLFFCYNHGLQLQLSPLAYWFLLFIGEDFLFWLEHYVDHSCRFFWAVHVTHHSSQEYNLSTGFRSSILMPLYRFMYFTPLALLGFRPMDILFMYAITQIYGILVHTQAIKKLPAFIEYIFVTPSHHRVHHASNIKYLDKNMGMGLIIWDRMFGTFAEEDPQEPPVYGLTKNVEHPHHPIHIITHEWEAIAKDLRKNISLKDKLRYVFMPPGWSHDGSTKTSKQLQAEVKQ